jgi:predicted SAM-dependent methyltransferase
MVKKYLLSIKDIIKLFYRRNRLKILAKKPGIKIVVGAGNVFEKGWVPTEIEFLNLLNHSDWDRYFRKDTIEAILAEHVWEHLSAEDGARAASNCFKYLRSGGYLRIAVPDGFHADPNYITYVKPGGTGLGSDDHKMLYDCNSIQKMLKEVGFTPHLVEWFDAQGKFHFEEWDRSSGMIHRSKRFDERNENGELKYTSLIVDAVKP